MGCYDEYVDGKYGVQLKAGQCLMHAFTVGDEVDLNDENLGGKVRKTKNEKIPYWIVVGDKESSSHEFTLESRSGEKQESLSYEKLLELLQKEIKEKK